MPDETSVILLDMDGVCCDFIGGALNRLSHYGVISFRPEYYLERWQAEFAGVWDVCDVTGLSQHDFWRAIDSYGDVFWRQLEELPLYPKLLNVIRESGCKFLFASAPSRVKTSYGGKCDWLSDRGFIPRNDAMLGSQKWLMAKPEHVLIDDSDENCTLFREHGGAAVLVPRVWNSLHSIAAMGDDAIAEYVLAELQTAIANKT